MPDSEWTDSDSKVDFDIDTDEGVELKTLHDKIMEEQTVRDPRIARRFFQLLDKANAPKKWTRLIRHPRLDGKDYMERDRENPPTVTSWKAGHEIQKWDNTIHWSCLYIETYPQLEMYVRHSLMVCRDGRLIGASLGETLNVQELDEVLNVWSKELEDNADKYWDDVEGSD